MASVLKIRESSVQKAGRKFAVTTSTFLRQNIYGIHICTESGLLSAEAEDGELQGRKNKVMFIYVIQHNLAVSFLSKEQRYTVTV